MKEPPENHTERRKLHPMIRSIHIFRRNVSLQKYHGRYQQPNLYFLNLDPYHFGQNDCSCSGTTPFAVTDHVKLAMDTQMHATQESGKSLESETILFEAHC